jgi:hypothetical protein
MRSVGDKLTPTDCCHSPLVVVLQPTFYRDTSFVLIIPDTTQSKRASIEKCLSNWYRLVQSESGDFDLNIHFSVDVDARWIMTSTMTYILPDQATSPRQSWSIIKVLVAGGPGDMSVALGKWEGTPVIGLRWNGSDESPVGNPQSRGLATWFVVERGTYTEAIIEALPEAEKSLGRNFIPKN